MHHYFVEIGCLCNEDLMTEFCDMLYDPVTGDSTELLKNGLSKFPVEEVKNGAIVIVAGFLP